MSQTQYTRTQMHYADSEVTVSVANAREATELVDWQTNGFSCMRTNPALQIGPMRTT